MDDDRTVLTEAVVEIGSEREWKARIDERGDRIRPIVSDNRHSNNGRIFGPP